MTGVGAADGSRSAAVSGVPRSMQILLALIRGQPQDTPDLPDLAAHHGLLGLSLIAMEKSGLVAALPAARAAEYRRSLSLLRRQAVVWDFERDAAVSRLAAAGIDAVLLKGAALRLTAYADPAARPFGDLDILVARDDLNAAVAALAERGYTGDSAERNQLYLEHHHHLILRKEPGFLIEVHWALQPKQSPLHLDAAAFLREARMITLPNGSAARVPTPEHMLLHVATQNMEDGFARLRRLVDIDRVLAATPGFDWPRLATDAQRMDAAPMLALSLRLAELLLGTPVPEGFIATLGVSAAARRHLALLDPVGLVVDRAALPRPAVSSLLALWCAPDRRARLRLFGEMASGAHDWFWQELEATGTPLERRWRGAVGASKLAVYQLSLYPAALFGRSMAARRAAAFWHGD